VDFGDQLLVVGDVDQLGGWELERAPHMVWTEGDVWQATVDMPSGTAAEFKFVLSSPKR
jgi:alpha-amylase